MDKNPAASDLFTGETNWGLLSFYVNFSHSSTAATERNIMFPLLFKASVLFILTPILVSVEESAATRVSPKAIFIVHALALKAE